MANEIDILMAGSATPNESELMAQALRGQLNEGNVLGMSTIAPVAQFGRSQAQAARSQAAERGRLAKALEKEQRQERREKEKESRAFKQWEKKQAILNQNAKDLAESKAKADKAAAEVQQAKGLKPTGKAVQDYTKSIDIAKQISDVGKVISEFDKGQLEQADQPFLEAMTGLIPSEDMERYTQEKFLFTDPKVRQFRAKAANVESEFSKLMSGLAVTGFEMKDRQKWSPFAGGISQEEREARFGNLYNNLNDKMDTMESTYDLGVIENFERPSFNIDKSKSQGSYMKITELDGKRYGQKPNGEWVEL